MPRAAVDLASAGTSGVMVTLEREEANEYRVRTGSAPLEAVANQAKRLPAAFISADGRGMTDAFVNYDGELHPGRFFSGNFTGAQITLNSFSDAFGTTGGPQGQPFRQGRREDDS